MLRRPKVTGETAAPAALLESQNILTPQQLAARLQVTPSWVRQKTRTRCPNPLPHYKIGRYIRFNWRAVAAWLEGTAA